MRYRKAFELDAPIWHFNPDCPDYPTRSYIVRADAPPVKDLCVKCAQPDAQRVKQTVPS